MVNLMDVGKIIKTLPKKTHTRKTVVYLSIKRKIPFYIFVYVQCYTTPFAMGLRNHYNNATIIVRVSYVERRDDTREQENEREYTRRGI